MRPRLLCFFAYNPYLIDPVVTLPLTSVVSATRMVARLSIAACIFDPLWLELTGLRIVQIANETQGNLPFLTAFMVIL